MAILVNKINAEKIKILIVKDFEKRNLNERLMSDILENLKEQGWRGLTSKDMYLETEKGTEHCWGGFAALLEKIGFTTRYEKHGAGLKTIVSI